MGTDSSNSKRSTGGWMTIGLLGAWTIALLVVGAFNAGETWGQIVLAAGVLAAIVVGLAAGFGGELSAVYGVLGLSALALVAAGVALSVGNLIAIGLLAVIVVGATAPIAYGLRPFADGRPAAAGGGTNSGDVKDLLYQIHEHSMLSDNAKRVLFRERELGLLRDAIEVDIRESKYDVALTLCDEMADVFGYVEEAEAFRGRIMQARRARYEEEVGHDLAQLDETLIARDWAGAHQAAARMRRLYGDSHLVADLDDRILAARDEHKRELERRFLEAAHKDDVEGAMAILKELDRYLTNEEADRLSEVAQGVVARHRENLGVQFKLAVSDRRWAEAVNIGEALVAEFPNTKMADEVRSMIDVLRTRAERTTLSTG